ncbi:MAG: hypothetical protein CM15mP74_20270 [Halieaceae bacterium]|nr:MAG: hypothetical protein CM15mP74_20270 [Halieaceae bacterium]
MSEVNQLSLFGLDLVGCIAAQFLAFIRFYGVMRRVCGPGYRPLCPPTS